MMAEEVHADMSEEIAPPPPPEICIREESGNPAEGAVDCAPIASSEALSDIEDDQSDADAFAKSPSRDSFIPSLGVPEEVNKSAESEEVTDSGYEKLDDSSEENGSRCESGDELISAKSPPMPRPPPPSPAPQKFHMDKTSSTEKDDRDDEDSDGANAGQDSPEAGASSYKAFGEEEEEEEEEPGSRVEAEEEAEEDQEEETAIAGQLGDLSLGSGDKIRITLPGKSKSKHQKKAEDHETQSQQVTSWVNFDDDNDEFGFSGTAEDVKLSAPPRPSGPPPKRPAPPKAKPHRPPPPKPAPPSGGAPKRPPPPKQAAPGES